MTSHDITQAVDKLFADLPDNDWDKVGQLLLSRIERLRSALSAIESLATSNDSPWFAEIARAALKGQT